MFEKLCFEIATYPPFCMMSWYILVFFWMASLTDDDSLMLLTDDDSLMLLTDNDTLMLLTDYDTLMLLSRMQTNGDTLMLLTDNDTLIDYYWVSLTIY